MATHPDSPLVAQRPADGSLFAAYSRALRLALLLVGLPAVYLWGIDLALAPSHASGELQADQRGFVLVFYGLLLVAFQWPPIALLLLRRRGAVPGVRWWAVLAALALQAWLGFEAERRMDGWLAALGPDPLLNTGFVRFGVPTLLSLGLVVLCLATARAPDAE